MKSTRLKTQPLASRAEFNTAVDSAANFATMIAYIEARRDKAIQRLQKFYGDKIVPLAVQRDLQVQLAETYADAHRAELLTKDRKSAEVATASFGWRTGMPAVKFISKKITEESAIAVLKQFGLGAYVRTVEQLAKDKILADAKTIDTAEGKVVGLPAVLNEKGEPAPEGATFPLTNAGLKITQTETFYIEPKLETAEAIKAAS